MFHDLLALMSRVLETPFELAFKTVYWCLDLLMCPVVWTVTNMLLRFVVAVWGDCWVSSRQYRVDDWARIDMDGKQRCLFPRQRTWIDI